MSGLFVVIEGIDGTGKTTQVNRAVAYLRSRFGTDVVETTKDLGGSLLGEQLREIMYKSVPPRDMAPGVLDLLFLAGHVQNWHTLVKPWLAANRVVISDRWWLSEFAYAAGRAHHPDVLELYAKMKGGWPHAAIFLHGDPHEMLARANARADSDVHQKQKAWNDAEKQRRVCKKYFELYDGHRGWCPISVDNKDADAVWLCVREAIDAALKEKGYVRP